jgi:hypothetical protein
MTVSHRRARHSAMRKMPLEFLYCRDRSIGHDWDVGHPETTFQFGVVTNRKGMQEILRKSRCERCQMLREEHFSHIGPNGRAVKTHTVYTAPEGYSLPQDPDLGPVRSADVWAEQMRRAKVKFDPAKVTVALGEETAAPVRKIRLKSVSA